MRDIDEPFGLTSAIIGPYNCFYKTIFKQGKVEHGKMGFLSEFMDINTDTPCLP
jgi:hypothetical protein